MHLYSLWRLDQTQFDCGQPAEDRPRCLEFIAALLPQTLKKTCRPSLYAAALRWNSKAPLDRNSG